MAADDKRSFPIKKNIRRRHPNPIGRYVAVGFCMVFLACSGSLPGEALCPPDPAGVEDTCPETPNFGAVVVRWRIADVSLSRLLPRGVCCCNPKPSRNGIDRRQCGEVGSSCLDAPAWLIQHVLLSVRAVNPDPDGPVLRVFNIPCTDGEYSTPYCIKPGLYDLQLTASVNALENSDGTGPQFACSGKRKAAAPPTTRRQVAPGRATNLDGIVLGINAP